jgi:hypothetical protein
MAVEGKDDVESDDVTTLSTNLYIYIYIYICICTYIYIYIYIHIYTYIFRIRPGHPPYQQICMHVCVCARVWMCMLCMRLTISNTDKAGSSVSKRQTAVIVCVCVCVNKCPSLPCMRSLCVHACMHTACIRFVVMSHYATCRNDLCLVCVCVCVCVCGRVCALRVEFVWVKNDS